MNPDLTSVTIEQLEPATWYFAVKAVNSAGVESDYSQRSQQEHSVVTGRTDTRDVAAVLQQNVTIWRQICGLSTVISAVIVRPRCARLVIDPRVEGNCSGHCATSVQQQQEGPRPTGRC